jgi:hypothetical protein
LVCLLLATTIMAEQVLAAIHVLYTSHDTREKDGADKWLEQWQQCPEAWSTSDGILHTPGVAGDAAYFCAQTLKTKVSSRVDLCGAGGAAATDGARPLPWLCHVAYSRRWLGPLRACSCPHI